MKDIQGITRGKCKLDQCECEEYRTTNKSGQIRCEYCNHTPADHVRIIELGKCSSRDCDCEKYESEEKNSYTDCAYCGCEAMLHSGAEKLRKSKPQHNPAGPPMAQQVMPGPGFQPRQDAYGQSLQQVEYGTCKFPGCTFPKRKEGDKVHDFCSRTCAKKYSNAQSQFFQQKTAEAARVAQQGSHPQQQGRGGLFSQQLMSAPSKAATPQTGSSSSFMTSSLPPSNSLPASNSQCQSSGSAVASSGGSAKLCSKCKLRQANPGRGWCQQCFLQTQS